MHYKNGNRLDLQKIKGDPIEEIGNSINRHAKIKGLSVPFQKKK